MASSLDNEQYVVLDTETTGLSFQEDRVIEIGAIKLHGRKPVSKFHVYLNPEKESSKQALAVHGLTTEFLRGKPLFADIYHDFLGFIEGSTLVIHNASFDMSFLQAELARVAYPVPLDKICKVIDTLQLAKKTFPGQKNNLDSLCSRYGIPTSHRSLHGALKDADLLVKVYLHLITNQHKLDLKNNLQGSGQSEVINNSPSWKGVIKLIKATENEVTLHDDYIKSMS